MGFLFGGNKTAASTSATTQTKSVGGENRASSFLKKRRGMKGRAAAMLTSSTKAPETAKRQVTGS